MPHKTDLYSSRNCQKNHHDQSQRPPWETDSTGQKTPSHGNRPRSVEKEHHSQAPINPLNHIIYAAGWIECGLSSQAGLGSNPGFTDTLALGSWQALPLSELPCPHLWTRESHHWLCRADAVFKEVNGSIWHEAGTCSVLASTSMDVSAWALSVNLKDGRILWWHKKKGDS